MPDEWQKTAVGKIWVNGIVSAKGTHYYNPRFNIMKADAKAVDGSWEMDIEPTQHVCVTNFMYKKRYLKGKTVHGWFYPSQFIYKHICNMKKENNINTINIPKNIIPLAICNEGTCIQEVFFQINNSEELKELAEHYKLPYPVNDYVTDKIDNDRMAIRFRSYDVYGRGEGEWMSITPASVIFDHGIPTELRFYTVERTEKKDK